MKSSQTAHLRDLIYPAVNLVVEDAGDEETLHVSNVNIQLFGDEGNVDAGVRFDQLDQHLRPDVAQQVFDVLSDRGEEKTFLDASTHLYKRVCPSFRRSVGNAFFSMSR